MPAAKRGRSEGKSAAAAAAGGSPGLNFKKMDHDQLRTMTQEVSASKPASSAVPVDTHNALTLGTLPLRTLSSRATLRSTLRCT